MATTPILGKDVYLALAAVGWADGQLTRAGADAIIRTALAEGLELEDIQTIEEATKAPVELGSIDRLGMSKSDRLYVYAVASWIAELDGQKSEQRSDALAKLGDALGVPVAPRKHADTIMKEIAGQSDRPERFDLITLRQTLDERLEEAHRMRMAYLAKKKAEEEEKKKAEEKETRAQQAKKKAETALRDMTSDAPRKSKAPASKSTKTSGPKSVKGKKKSGKKKASP
jgi:preprotein translocase subunit SecD